MNMQRVSSVRVNANIIIIEKDVFSHLVTSVGQRKNSESPWGIERQTFGVRARDNYWRQSVQISFTGNCFIHLRYYLFIWRKKKSILTGFFWTKNGLHLYPDFFSWQAKYKSTNGLFFLSVESIAELRPIFSIFLRLLKFIWRMLSHGIIRLKQRITLQQ